jgi:hypothetical protein
MKYMIMMFGGVGAAMADRSPEEVTEFHRLMTTMDGELRDAGELVASVKLADPSVASTVRVQGGVPAPTDGPFAEVKESLAGYWIIEADEARAVEVASRVVATSGFPMEVRQVMHAAPEA